MKHVTVISRSEIRLSRELVKSPGRRGVRHDDQGLYQQQVSGLCALCLHRGHALRSLPLGSEERAADQRRGGRRPQPHRERRKSAVEESQRIARCWINLIKTTAERLTGDGGFHQYLDRRSGRPPERTNPERPRPAQDVPGMRNLS